MEHKYTPAPWKIQEPRHFPNSENAHLFIVSDSALVSIMPELQSERTEESAANARLIAAAPELLQATIRMLNWLEGTSDEIDIIDMALQARAALQKATPRSQS